MLIALVFGFWSTRENLWAGAPNFITWFLIFLLGWQVFGPPIHG